MIDLHTHTTASDGKCSPDELVARAAAAGVTTLGLTDHDTVAGCAAAATACAQIGLSFIHGIEITAVAEERDIHVLAYFFDMESASLQSFLAEQRVRRVERVREMFDRLARRGLHLDADAILGPGVADPTRAVGRPWIARALVEAGYVANVGEAFDRWLSRGCPGFVPRVGATPAAVFAHVHDAGGIASLAHPVLVRRDEWIPAFAAAGLDALEAFHADHDAADTARYLALAADCNLLVTGGSDYHADDEHGGGGPGSVVLPQAYFDRLVGAAHR
ncbi:MAG TPA: PHP domain-containing protein [Vicinamibacterales bacterium]|nr:PHP domain-containing protein [Vicinamibacterales bacterium]